MSLEFRDTSNPDSFGNTPASEENCNQLNLEIERLCAEKEQLYVCLTETQEDLASLYSSKKVLIDFVGVLRVMRNFLVTSTGIERLDDMRCHEKELSNLMDHCHSMLKYYLQNRKVTEYEGSNDSDSDLEDSSEDWKSSGGVNKRAKYEVRTNSGNQLSLGDSFDPDARTAWTCARPRRPRPRARASRRRSPPPRQARAPRARASPARRPHPPRPVVFSTSLNPPCTTKLRSYGTGTATRSGIEDLNAHSYSGTSRDTGRIGA